jgi:hypothetical protein
MPPAVGLVVQLAAEFGVMPLVLVIVGSGGVSAIVTGFVAFRRMTIQNTVDVRTIAAREAEVAVEALQQALVAQATFIKRQGTEIKRLRGDVRRCEAKCVELSARLRRTE